MARFALIEDDLHTQQTLYGYLHSHGHETLALGSSGLSIAAVERFRPDIAIVGLMLRHISGFELCRAIRRSGMLHRASVLVCSASSDEEEQQHIIRQGADDFLLKPFKAVDVVEKLERLYALHHAANGLEPRTGLPLVERFKKSLGHRLALGDQVSLCCFEVHGLALYREHHGQEEYDAVLRRGAQAVKEAAAMHGLGLDDCGFLGGGFLGAIVSVAHAQQFCFDVKCSLVRATRGQRHGELPILVRIVRPAPQRCPNVTDTLATLHALIDAVNLSQEGEFFIDRRHGVGELAHAV